MSSSEIIVSADAHSLASDVAQRLIARLAAAQQKRGEASVVLTGGRIATAALSAVREAPNRDTVQWEQVHVWWSDDRFMPRDSQERNATAAFNALLSHVRLTPENVHAIPSSDEFATLDEAAEAYTTDLSAAASHNTALPHCDVLLLSIGEDGHVASLFPHAAATHEERSIVTAVHNAPKPPPERVTWTFPAINSASEVWVLASGASKADAVVAAREKPHRSDVPAAGVHGEERTVWMCDRAAYPSPASR